MNAARRRAAAAGKPYRTNARNNKRSMYRGIAPRAIATANIALNASSARHRNHRSKRLTISAAAAAWRWRGVGNHKQRSGINITAALAGIGSGDVAANEKKKKGISSRRRGTARRRDARRVPKHASARIFARMALAQRSAHGGIEKWHQHGEKQRNQRCSNEATGSKYRSGVGEKIAKIINGSSIA